MVRPAGAPGPSSPLSRGRRASVLAATSMAGFSRKLSVSGSNLSRERASRSSGSSPAHSRRRNASRSFGERCSAACRRLSSCPHRFESIACLAAQFAVKPKLGDAPVAPHGGGRHFEHFGRLLHAESAKKAHLNDLHLPWI